MRNGPAGVSSASHSVQDFLRLSACAPDRRLGAIAYSSELIGKHALCDKSHIFFAFFPEILIVCCVASRSNQLRPLPNPTSRLFGRSQQKEDAGLCVHQACERVPDEGNICLTPTKRHTMKKILLSTAVTARSSARATRSCHGRR